MNTTFTIALTFFDGEKASGEATFSKIEGDYGNKYYLGIKLQSWRNSYDIRYDRDFHENDMIPYLVSFLWKMYNIKGIEVVLKEEQK